MLKKIWLCAVGKIKLAAVSSLQILLAYRGLHAPMLPDGACTTMTRTIGAVVSTGIERYCTVFGVLASVTYNAIRTVLRL